MYFAYRHRRLPTPHRVCLAMQFPPDCDEETFLRLGKDTGEHIAPVNRVPMLHYLQTTSGTGRTKRKDGGIQRTSTNTRSFATSGAKGISVPDYLTSSPTRYLSDGTRPAFLSYLLSPARETVFSSPNHMTTCTTIYYISARMMWGCTKE